MKPDDPLPDDDSIPERFSHHVPSEDWIDAFEEQCTAPLLKRARRYAAQRARDAGWEATAAGSDGPDELVDNIVKDTIDGVLRWDPSVRRFQRHLYDAIRLRVNRHAKRAARHPHESIDAMDADGESPGMAEMEAKLLADAPTATDDTAARATDIFHALQPLAVDKPLVEALLGAFARKAFDKEDVMRVAQMTPADYHNARRQLTRLVEQLPDHLKPRGYLASKGT
jgi:hypothetical protein